MHNAERYPYTAIDSALGEAGLAPYVPLRLTYQGREVTVGGLLDTGATVNVLPYPVGVELGAVWEHQTTVLRLTGNLAQFDARALLVSAVAGPFPPLRLVFARTQVPTVPVLLGQPTSHLRPVAPRSRRRAVDQARGRGVLSASCERRLIEYCPEPRENN